MNKQRRNVISKYMAELEEIQSTLNNIKEGIEDVRDSEDEAFSNLPDSLQYSEKGDIMQECVDGLDDAISQIEDIASNIDDINEVLQDVIDK